MEIRVLRYFLVTAREQNITKAAELLHITQPTLSRQLAALEEELGTSLFIRGNKKITLTEKGILLKRRAMEILELEEKTLEEIFDKEHLVEGSVTIGCGEYGATETLANWFGKDYEKLNAAFVGNLATNSAVMAQNGLAYLITIEGAMRFWDKSRLTYRKLSPEMSSKTLIAWRRNIPYSLAVTKFIEEINAFQA